VSRSEGGADVNQRSRSVDFELGRVIDAEEDLVPDTADASSIDGFEIANEATDDHEDGADLGCDKHDDSGLPADLLAEYRTAFQMLDLDGDGAISIGEVAAKMHRCGHDATEKELRVMCEKLTGGADKITFSQFCQVMERLDSNPNTHQAHVGSRHMAGERDRNSVRPLRFLRWVEDKIGDLDKAAREAALVQIATRDFEQKLPPSLQQRRDRPKANAASFERLYKDAEKKTARLLLARQKQERFAAEEQDRDNAIKICSGTHEDVQMAVERLHAAGERKQAKLEKVRSQQAADIDASAKETIRKSGAGCVCWKRLYNDRCVKSQKQVFNYKQSEQKDRQYLEANSVHRAVNQRKNKAVLVNMLIDRLHKEGKRRDVCLERRRKQMHAEDIALMDKWSVHRNAANDGSWDDFFERLQAREYVRNQWEQLRRTHSLLEAKTFGRPQVDPDDVAARHNLLYRDHFRREEDRKQWRAEDERGMARSADAQVRKGTPEEISRIVAGLHSARPRGFDRWARDGHRRTSSAPERRESDSDGYSVGVDLDQRGDDEAHVVDSIAKGEGLDNLICASSGGVCHFEDEDFKTWREPTFKTRLDTDASDRETGLASDASLSDPSVNDDIQALLTADATMENIAATTLLATSLRRPQQGTTNKTRQAQETVRKATAGHGKDSRHASRPSTSGVPRNSMRRPCRERASTPIEQGPRRGPLGPVRSAPRASSARLNRAGTFLLVAQGQS